MTDQKHWLRLAARLLLFWSVFCATAATATSGVPHDAWRTCSPGFALSKTIGAPASCQIAASDDGTNVRLVYHAYAERQRDLAVVIGLTRLQRVDVTFTYQDGMQQVQTAKAGQFGDHWRIGGTIAFVAAIRNAPIVTATIVLKDLHSPELLKIRLGSARSATQSGGLLLIGAALALLLVTITGNLILAGVVRQLAPAFHAVWAALVLGWALSWSQVLLYFLPQTAGIWSARLTTLFSTLAISAAGLAFVHGSRPVLDRGIGKILVFAAAAVSVAGTLTALAPADRLQLLSTALNGSIGFATLMLFFGLAQASWRGDHAARGFAVSFVVPIVAVLWSIAADQGINGRDWSGRYLVLVACALQTFVLTLLAARRVWQVRIDRDHAAARSREMAYLADSDFLTGLLNRRGFMLRAEEALAQHRVALLLVDIDHFKRVNDQFGHAAGDAVLQDVAGILAGCSRQHLVGRLGGEEFAVLIENPAAASMIAESIRLRLRHCALPAQAQPRFLTVSIGVAEALAGEPFGDLYQRADAALYNAKSAGRDRVVTAAGENHNTTVFRQINRYA